MALIRFRPFPQVLDSSRNVMDIQTQMNRLFDNFFGQPSPSGLMEHAITPPVDMYETKDEVVVAVELPGVNEKDIRLSVTGDLLTIQGERQWSDETGQVKATYRDGVLTVKLPKTEGVKPKEIKIDAV